MVVDVIILLLILYIPTVMSLAGASNENTVDEEQVQIPVEEILREFLSGFARGLETEDFAECIEDAGAIVSMTEQIVGLVEDGFEKKSGMMICSMLLQHLSDILVKQLIKAFELMGVLLQDLVLTL